MYVQLSTKPTIQITTNKCVNQNQSWKTKQYAHFDRSIEEKFKKKGEYFTNIIIFPYLT